MNIREELELVKFRIMEEINSYPAATDNKFVCGKILGLRKALDIIEEEIK